MARGKPRADGTVIPQGPNYGGALSAIKKYCKDCMPDENPRKCTCDGCWLYPFRSGRGPDVARHDGWKVDPTKELVGRLKRDKGAK